jgi:DNA-binding NarL/FixJ family response regulator
MLTVAIAEDSIFVREGIGHMLADHDEIAIVASCGDMPSLVAAVETHRPDVVLTDIRMPPTETDEGIRIAAQLRETHPSIGVVVLSQFSEPEFALALLQDGSDRRAYMLKERVRNRAELLAAIRAVAAGGSWVDPMIVDVLVARQTEDKNSRLGELTARELEVLTLLAHGASNAAIADELVLTKRAVEKHINSIFMKLALADSQEVSKRVKAALMFLAETGTDASP